MTSWDNFFLAQVGASAALTGLIFVGVSINLSRILSIPKLPNRAFGALLLLLTVLVVSSLLLVPGQPPRLLGTEILVIGICVWTAVLRIDLAAWRDTKPPHRRRVPALITLNQLAVAPYAVAGALLFARNPQGLYWLVPAVLFSFVKAVIDAWVLLVEINR